MRVRDEQHRSVAEGRTGAALRAGAAGAERWMLDQREIWEQRLDRMQDYVEGLATNKEKP